LITIRNSEKEEKIQYNLSKSTKRILSPTATARKIESTRSENKLLENRIETKEFIQKFSVFFSENEKFDLKLFFSKLTANIFTPCVSRFKKDKDTQLYTHAISLLEEYMGIETLFMKYQEIETIKEFLFDTHQQSLFQFISKYSSYRYLLSRMSKQQSQNKQIEDFSYNIKILTDRNNKEDIWLLNTLNVLLKK
jgi:hypothetical protein